MLTTAHDRLDDPRPELNTTPLIDVMLVLLTMFMLTVPVMTHSVNIDSAAGAMRASVAPPIAVIEIDFDGTIHWNGQPLPLAGVARQTRELVARSEKAEFHVRASRLVRYEFVVQVLAEAQRNGARRIRFLGNERYL